MQSFPGISIATRHLAPMVLALIVIVAFWARASGVDYALPYVGFQPDEHLVTDQAIAMLKTGDFDIRHYPGPRLMAYVQAAVGKAALWYKSVFDKPVSAADILLTGDTSFWSGLAGVPEYYLWGRLAVATLGSLTVLLTYLIARTIHSSPAGLIAAAFIALSPIHARESRWITTDVAVTFFLVASFFAMALAVKYDRRLFLMAGFALAGLTIYTKSNGRMVLLTTFLFSALYIAKGKGRRLKEAVLLGVGALLVLLLGAPFTGLGMDMVAALPNYLIRPIWDNSYVFGGAHPAFDGVASWAWTINTLAANEWKYVALLSVVGAVWFVFKHPMWTVLLAAIPVANLAMFSFFTVRFDRWLTPILPFVSVLAGLFVWDFASMLVRFAARSGGAVRPKPQPPATGIGESRFEPVSALPQAVVSSRIEWPLWIAGAICVAMVVLLLRGPAAEIAQHHRSLRDPDPRPAASEWITRNVSPGSKIAVERYPPAVSQHDYKVVGSLFLSNNDIDWYRREGFDYVIASSLAYDRFVSRPDRYPEQSARYQAFFNDFLLVKDFGGPGPKVKILKVARRTD